MLLTPASFVSLLAAQDHPQPFNFVFRGDELLVREADLALPDAAVLALLAPLASSRLPVGLLANRYCQAMWLDKAAMPAEGFAFRKLRSLFGAMDDALLAVAGRSFQIADWARTHRFCGACGTATVHVQGERCVKCPACGFVAYPGSHPR